MKTRLLHALLFAGLLGCSKSHPEETVLRLAFETSPNKLDPAFVIDVAEGQLCSMIFQGLVRFSVSGEIVPDAAKSWDVSEDGRRYVFHLDRRMRFSNGRRVRASDVVSSFERVLAAETGSPRTWVLDRIRGSDSYSRGERPSISGLSAIDDSTVVVELTEPFAPFLQLLGMPAACIVPGDVVRSGREAFAVHPVGSGRWRLAAWERGDYLLLEPNPHHPAAEPDIDRIEFRIVPEAFTRIAEFEAGNLDILKIPLAELGRFLGDASLGERIQSRPELRVTYVGLNNSRGPLRDARVRRALNMAVDVERIIDVLTHGRGVRAKGSIPPTLRGFREREPYPYDPGRARRLLSQAGYPEGFGIDIWQRESPEGNRIVEAIQGYLQEVGVRVRVVKREWSAFKEAVSQGRVDAFFLDWYADYPDAENFLFPLFHSQNAGGGGNRSFFANVEVDRLIEQAQRTMTPSQSARIYATIDSLVYEQAPWIYLYFPTTFIVVSPRLQGYVFPVLYLGEDYSIVRKAGKGSS